MDPMRWELSRACLVRLGMLLVVSALWALFDIINIIYPCCENRPCASACCVIAGGVISSESAVLVGMQPTAVHPAGCASPSR